MAMVKSLVGHTTCAKNIQEYLEYGDKDEHGVRAYLDKGGRAIGHDFWNVDFYERDNWAQSFDNTRHIYNNDISEKGRRRLRTYNHYIISPDPQDNISLDKLRELVARWVEMNDVFSDVQIAVTYHDDNKNHVPHAHIIVNNTHLNSGRKVHINKAASRKLAYSLQAIAKEMGMHHFPNTFDTSREEFLQQHFLEQLHFDEKVLELAQDDSISKEERDKKIAELRAEVHKLADQFRSDERLRKVHKPSLELEHITKNEQKILNAGGVSWKMDLRDWAIIAAETCDGTMEGFERRMADFGVRIGKARNGDILFIHPKSTKTKKDGKVNYSKQIKGATLGFNYNRENITKRIRRSKFQRVILDDLNVDSLKLNVADVSVVSGFLNVSVEQVANARKKAGISLHEVREAMMISSAACFTSLDEIRYRIEELQEEIDATPRREDYVKELEEKKANYEKCMYVLETTNLLPQTSPKSDELRKTSTTVERKIELGERIKKADYDKLSDEQREIFKYNIRLKNAGIDMYQITPERKAELRQRLKENEMSKDVKFIKRTFAEDTAADNEATGHAISEPEQVRTR